MPRHFQYMTVPETSVMALTALISLPLPSSHMPLNINELLDASLISANSSEEELYACYVLVGDEGVLLPTEKSRRHEQGYCMIVPSLTPLFYLGGENTLTCLLFKNWNRAARPPHDFYNASLSLRQDVLKHIDHIASLISRSNPFHAAEAQQLFQQLYWQVVQGSELQDEGRNELHEAVEAAIIYMSRHYHQAISFSALAKQLGLPHWKFGAEFKKLTGKTPIDYLTALRIQLSKQQLQSALAIREVAQQAGFRDEFYFSRRFRQATGQSPTGYRASPADRPRIVCLQYAAELITLGVRPIATNLHMLDVLGEDDQDVVRIDYTATSEQIMQLAPTLIIYPSYMPLVRLGHLLHAAPCLMIDWEDDMYTRLRKLGAVLGRAKEGEAWIQSYEHLAQSWRHRLREQIGDGETAAAFIVHSGQLYVYTDHHAGHVLYYSLGFKQPAALKDLLRQTTGVKWIAIQPKQIGQFAGDRIFIVQPSDPQDVQQTERLMQSNYWRELEAVKQGRTYIVAESLMHYTPIIVEKLLGEIGQRLLSQQ